MKINKNELKKGLIDTRYYIFSHHEYSQLYRCYSLSIFNKETHVCARCLGVYPGILFGIIAYLFYTSELTNIALVFVLPLPALIDWSITSFTDFHGHNIIRTGTGIFLGTGYGLGILIFVSTLDARILAIGVIYSMVASILLFVSFETG